MTPEEAKEEAKKVGHEFRRWRAVVLSEVWAELRDAPAGPMIDAMKVVSKMMEEGDNGDRRPEDG